MAAAKPRATNAMGPTALGLTVASLALRRDQTIPGPGAVVLTAAMSVLLGVTAWAELSYTTWSASKATTTSIPTRKSATSPSPSYSAC